MFVESYLFEYVAVWYQINMWLVRNEDVYDISSGNSAMCIFWDTRKIPRMGWMSWEVLLSICEGLSKNKWFVDILCIIKKKRKWKFMQSQVWLKSKYGNTILSDDNVQNVDIPWSLFRWIFFE